MTVIPIPRITAPKANQCLRKRKAQPREGYDPNDQTCRRADDSYLEHSFPGFLKNLDHLLEIEAIISAENADEEDRRGCIKPCPIRLDHPYEECID